PGEGTAADCRQQKSANRLFTRAAQPRRPASTTPAHRTTTAVRIACVGRPDLRSAKRSKLRAERVIVVTAMKHVVILGAGFAGLELATRLSESLAGEVRVTLLDQSDSFSFGFSKLDILFGRKSTADVLLHYCEIATEG